MGITELGDVHVDWQAISNHNRSRSYGFLNESHQMLLGGVRDLLETNSSNAFATDFGGDQDQRLLSDGTPPLELFAATNERLVYFDFPLERLPPRSHHGASQLVEACPGSFVTAQTQGPLKPQGTDSGLLIRY